MASGYVLQGRKKKEKEKKVQDSWLHDVGS
jgi:hypothetical protein